MPSGLEWLLLGLVAAIFVSAWRDRPANREKREGWSRPRWVLDRIALVITALFVLVALPLGVLVGMDWIEEDPSSTDQTFEQRLWLDSPSTSDKDRRTRWRMVEDAAAQIRPGMTSDEVRAILGDPTYEEHGAGEGGETMAYVISWVAGPFSTPQRRILITLEEGFVTHCWVRRGGS